MAQSIITDKNKGFKRYIPYLSAALVILLLLSNFFLLRFYLANYQKSTFITNENTKLEFTKLQLEAEFQTNLNNLNAMRGENSELNKMIEVKKAELFEAKAKLDLQISKNANYGDIKSAMAAMTNQNKENIRQLESLRNDNVALKEQVRKNEVQITQLEETKNVLQSSLDSMDAIQEAQAKAIEEANRQSIIAQTTVANLDEQIKKASFIAVGNVVITPQNIRRGKGEATTKTRKIDQYNICFTPAVNPLIKKRNQVFYLQLSNSLGESIPIGHDETNSGGFPVRFVRPVEMDYDGSPVTKCIDWVPESKLTTGVYELKIYNNGIFVGSNKFTIK